MYYLTSSQFFGWAPNIPQNDEKSEASVLQAELYMTSSTNFFMTCFPTVVNFPGFFSFPLFVCLFACLFSFNFSLFICLNGQSHKTHIITDKLWNLEIDTS